MLMRMPPAVVRDGYPPHSYPSVCRYDRDTSLLFINLSINFNVSTSEQIVLRETYRSQIARKYLISLNLE